MERYKNIGILLGMIGLILFLSVPLSANAEVRTGGVKISLTCYEDVAGERRIFHRKPELVPNERVSYIISVKNHGADAWIRLRTDFAADTADDLSNVIAGDHWFNGVDNNWIKAGEYWYYTKILKSGETVDFCKEVQIPDINALPDGMEFEIISRAEAVQASHIAPDFSSDNPFAGICIEGSSENEEWEKSGTGFEVIYEHGADTILSTDALFADVKTLMPGDEKRQIVVIKNANSYPIQVKMREVGDAIDERLLKVLNLTIQRGDKKIYDGPLADHALKNGLVLGEYKKNTEGSLEFRLSLAEDAGNETAFKTIHLAMIFSVEPLRENRDYDEGNSGEDMEKDESAVMYSYPDPSVEKGYSGGVWKLINEENHIWEYYFSDGSRARDGWLYLYNPYSQDEDKNGWFCFNKKGIMQYGWIKTENENWYFCHEISDGNLGRLKKGWHHDYDDRREYYLDPVTGIMQTGWREIDGKYYYFTPLEQTYRQNWFWNTKVGRWIYDFLGYRTYGSMFKNEKTPDGSLVGIDGVWIGE